MTKRLKRCRKCKKQLALDDFFKEKKGKYGRKGTCIECTYIYRHSTGVHKRRSAKKATVHFAPNTLAEFNNIKIPKNQRFRPHCGCTNAHVVKIAENLSEVTCKSCRNAVIWHKRIDNESAKKFNICAVHSAFYKYSDKAIKQAISTKTATPIAYCRKCKKMFIPDYAVGTLICNKRLHKKLTQCACITQNKVEKEITVHPPCIICGSCNDYTHSFLENSKTYHTLYSKVRGRGLTCADPTCLSKVNKMIRKHPRIRATELMLYTVHKIKGMDEVIYAYLKLTHLIKEKGTSNEKT